MVLKNNVKDIYQLSPLQEGLYFHYLLDKNDPALLGQLSYRISNSLDVSCVKRSFSELVNRHDALKTVFSDKKAGMLLQIVRKQVEPTFIFDDISSLSPDQQSEKIKAIKDADKHVQFNLDADILMRLTLLKISHDEYEMIWSFHHIIMDGWCISILFNEFAELYFSLVQDKKPALPAAKQYGEYIKWIESRNKELSRQYWQSYLNGYVTKPLLVEKSFHSDNRKFIKGELTVELTKNETTQLNQLAKKNGVTTNVVLQALWGIMLGKMNSTDDVTFGYVSSGRPNELPGVERMIGLFINTLPKRIRFASEMKLTSLFQEIHKSVIESAEHQHFSLAEITREHGGQPLFNHIVVFENTPSVEDLNDDHHGASLSKPGLLNISRTSVEEMTNYEFHVTIAPIEKLFIKLYFNQLIYDTTYMERIGKYIYIFIHQALSLNDPDVGELRLDNPEEVDQVVRGFNNTAVHFEGATKTICRQFKDLALQNPERAAIVYDQEIVSYSTLEQQANNLAHFLLNNCSITAGNTIAILLDNSPSSIVSLLAILKCGAVFLPIDCRTPSVRVNSLLKESDTKVLLTDSHYFFNAQLEFGGIVIALDIQMDLLEEVAMTIDHGRIMDKAYILFTSGSTGKPKGVEVCQDSLINYLLWANQYYFNNQRGYNFPLLTSLSFDLTFTSIFTTLLRGDTIYIYPVNSVLQNALDHVFTNPDIKVVKLTPSHIRLLKHSSITSTQVQKVILGGEKIKPGDIQLLKSLNPQITIYNEYGPTETTIGCTASIIEPGMDTNNIGNPIANTTISIVDDHLNILPVGVPGEILVGGRGVAKGYLNDPALTSSKFIDNFTPLHTSAKLYRTGDIGYWCEDGSIQYTSRKDNQVKIRGYRVEPREIEEIIEGHFAVDECVIAPFSVEGDLRSLYAIIIPNKKFAFSGEPRSEYAQVVSETDNDYFDSEEKLLANIRSHCATNLPDYMVPASFFVFQELPLNSNGKPDHASINTMLKTLIESKRDLKMPSNYIETSLLEIWRKVLGKEHISMDDDFFSIGGHSIHATAVASYIRKDLQLQVELKLLFEFTTISELAEQLEKSPELRYKPVPKIKVKRPYYELSSAQRRMWITCQNEMLNKAYNVPATFNFQGHLDISLLTKAFNLLVDRHEILRTTFREIEGEPKQVILPSDELADVVECHDFSSNSSPNEVAKVYIGNVIATAFDLDRGPLFKICVIKVAENSHVIAFVIHHIICDGETISILFREFVERYNTLANGNELASPALRIQNSDYTEWQNQFLMSQESNQHLEFWRNKLTGANMKVQLPFDFNDSIQNGQNQGKHLRFDLDPDLSISITELSKKEKSTLFISLLAITKVVLYYISGNQNDIVIGTPVSERVHPDLDGQLGYFLNTLPIRTQIEEERPFIELLSSIKQSHLDAMQHYQFPFDKIFDSVNGASSDVQLFNVLITMQNVAVGSERALHGIQVSEFEMETTSSKFDLTIGYTATEKTINCMLEYNAALFTDDTIRMIRGFLIMAMEKFSSDPSCVIREFASVIVAEN